MKVNIDPTEPGAMTLAIVLTGVERESVRTNKARSD